MLLCVGVSLLMQIHAQSRIYISFLSAYKNFKCISKMWHKSK